MILLAWLVIILTNLSLQLISKDFNMKDDIKFIIRRISIQIACFIIIGLLLIGLLSYYFTIIKKKERYLKSKAWIISYWLFGFIILYVVMSFLNIYMFGFYPVDERYTVWLYLKQSVKIGGILGIGIGLGSLISTFIFKEKSLMN